MEVVKAVPPSGKDEIAALRERTVKACGEELRALLERHGCVLVAQPVLTTDGRIVANVVLKVAE